MCIPLSFVIFFFSFLTVYSRTRIRGEISIVLTFQQASQEVVNFLLQFSSIQSHERYSYKCEVTYGKNKSA